MLSDDQKDTIQMGDYTIYVPKANTLHDFATIENPGGIDMYELEQRQRTVPDIQASKNLDIDRSDLNKQPRGTYQLAIKAERIALRDGLLRWLNNINTDLQLDLTRDDVENITKFIPNARFAYYNKLIKKILAGEIPTQGDYDYIDTVWMNDQTKNSLRKLFKNHSNKTGFTVQPTPPKSGIAFQDREGKGLRIDLKNPGTIVKDDNESWINKIQKYSQVLQPVQDMLNELEQLVNNYEQTSVIDEIDMDPKFKRLITQMRSDLFEKHLSYDKMTEIADAFSHFANMSKSKYILSLVDPFKHRAAKIPTELPIPSTTLSLRHNLNLTTNALGNVAFTFNPYSLNFINQTGFFLNNDPTLIGNAFNNNFLGINVGQMLPAYLYSKYRLVSAAIKLTFTSSLLNTQGYSTVGINFENLPVQTVGVLSPESAWFGDFSRMENTYFKDSIATRSGETLQSNYIPLDSSFLDYVGTNAVPATGFFIAGYVTGAPPTTVVARVDLIMNFEAVVAVDFTDYLPCNTYTGSLDDLKMLPVITGRVSSFTPKEIERVIAEEKPIKLNKIVELPQDSRKAQEIKNLTRLVTGVRDNTLNRLVFDEKPSIRKSLISDVMDFIAPAMSGLIKTASSSLKDIFLPQMFMK